jgi:NO-binding membrane sensor protein with MHYT domain
VGEVHVAFGWASAALLWALSFVGSLLGILLATKARYSRGVARARLVGYASVALGGLGIWQMHVMGLLDLSVPGLTLRLNPLWTAASMAVALLSVAAALFVAGRATPRLTRLVAAATLLAAGVVATHVIALLGLRVAGKMEFETPGTWVCVGFAGTAAAAILGSTVALHSVRAALGTAATIAAALTATHYAAMWAVCVRVDSDGYGGVTGASPLLAIVLVTVIGGAGTAMLAYFTFGRSTVHDLRAIYVNPHDSSDVVQPAIIQAVATLVSRALEPIAIADGVVVADVVAQRRAPGPRPTPGLIPAWRGMPIWGGPKAAARQQNKDMAVVAVRYPSVVYTGSPQPSSAQLTFQRNRGRFCDIP